MKLLVAMLAIASASTASADAAATQPFYASPRWGSFEISVSGYTPRVDAEFGAGVKGPYETTFGGGRHYMVRVDGAYSLFVDYGTLDVGLGLGFTQMTGHGLLPDGTVSSDLTRFRVLPARATLTYRFDVIAKRYPIPLVPFVRLSLDRYWWWIYNGSDATASAGGKAGSGATNGYSVSGGMAFLLDFIDRGLARDLDRNTGINHTYAYVEFTKSWIDDFGSATSWDLSHDKIAVAGGLLFVF